MQTADHEGHEASVQSALSMFDPELSLPLLRDPPQVMIRAGVRMRLVVELGLKEVELGLTENSAPAARCRIRVRIDATYICV